jgi:hypothetical protein
MREDRLVRMDVVKRSLDNVPWYRLEDGEMKDGASYGENAWYRYVDIEEALKLVPTAAQAKPKCERVVLDDPDKLSEGDGSMIEELMRRVDEIPPRNVLMHRDICTYLSELYARKNHDYGDSFHKTYLEEGMAMARIRLTDKLERFKKLTREGGRAVKDESIRDTLIDLASYAIMTVMEMDREAEENEKNNH